MGLLVEDARHSAEYRVRRAHFETDAAHTFGQRKKGSRIIELGLLLFLFVILMGCSAKRDRKAQTDALNQSFKPQAVILRINLGRVGSKCGVDSWLGDGDDLMNQIKYHAAQKAKLIAITPDGPGFWKVELVQPTPKIVEFLKGVHHSVQEGCDAVRWGFVIATKSADITNVREISGDKVEVEFTWKWTLSPHYGVNLVDNLSEKERVELNPYLVNSSPSQADSQFSLVDIGGSPVPHSAKKTLKKSVDGWVVDEL